MHYWQYFGSIFYIFLALGPGSDRDVMRKKHFMSRKTEKEEGHLELKKLELIF